jgi:hypothetical protein
LYSLIAQRDNKTKLQLAKGSAKLAQASKKDSYAIKTISVLTILFLPGAYVATLFTTNMFVFRDGEEVWVYWAVVIPLTAAVMTIWLLWMRKFKDNPDAETGLGGSVANDKKAGKQS